MRMPEKRVLTKREASSSPGRATAALAKDQKRRTLGTLTSVRLTTSTNKTRTPALLQSSNSRTLEETQRLHSGCIVLTDWPLRVLSYLGLS